MLGEVIEAWAVYEDFSYENTLGIDDSGAQSAVIEILSGPMKGRVVRLTMEVVADGQPAKA